MCLYNYDSGDDLIPELDLSSDSESDNEIPISPVARPIEKNTILFIVLLFFHFQKIKVQIIN